MGSGGPQGWIQQADVLPHPGGASCALPSLQPWGSCTNRCTCPVAVSPLATSCHPCPPGASSAGGAWAYTVRLRLEDATGQLDAVVFGPDGALPGSLLCSSQLHAQASVCCHARLVMPGGVGGWGVPRQRHRPMPAPVEPTAGPASLLAQGRRSLATCRPGTCGPTQRRRRSCSGACTSCWARAASGECQPGCGAGGKLLRQAGRVGGHGRPWEAIDIPTSPARAASTALTTPPARPRLCRRGRDGGPWMELCLKSYYGDPARPWQTRQFRVFGSTLQLLPAPLAEG